MKRPTRYIGRARTIAFAVGANGKSPGLDFFSNELDLDGKVKMDKLFKWMGDHGQINNDQKFKPVSGPIFEFKDHQIRMLCFRAGNSWIVTHGFFKRQDKIPPT